MKRNSKLYENWTEKFFWISNNKIHPEKRKNPEKLQILYFDVHFKKYKLETKKYTLEDTNPRRHPFNNRFRWSELQIGHFLYGIEWPYFEEPTFKSQLSSRVTNGQKSEKFKIGQMAYQIERKLTGNLMHSFLTSTEHHPRSRDLARGKQIENWTFRNKVGHRLITDPQKLKILISIC